MGDRGVAFVQRVNGKQKLVVADIRKKRLHAVSGPMENIESFDVRDLAHFVFIAPDPAQIKELKQKERADKQKSAVVGTGRRLGQLVLPDDPVVVEYSLPHGCLWASVGGGPFKLVLWGFLHPANIAKTLGPEQILDDELGCPADIDVFYEADCGDFRWRFRGER